MKKLLLIFTMLLVFPITVFASNVDWNRFGVRFNKLGPAINIEVIKDKLYYFSGNKIYMFDKKAENLIKSIEIEYQEHFVINDIIYLIAYRTELIDNSNYRKSTMYFTTLNSNLEKINNSSLLFDYRNSPFRLSTFTFIKNDKLQLFSVHDDILTLNSDGTITNPLKESNGNYIFGQRYFKTDGTSRYIDLNGVTRLYKFQDGYVTYSNNTGSGQSPNFQPEFYLFKLGEEATFNYSDRILLAKTSDYNVAKLFYAENMDLYADISGRFYKVNDDYTLGPESSEVKPLLPKHDYSKKITLGDDYCKELATLPCSTIAGIDRNEKSLYLVSETNQSDYKYTLIYKNSDNVKTTRLNVNNSKINAAVGYFKDYIVLAYKVNDKNYLNIYNQKLNLVKEKIEVNDIKSSSPRDITQSEKGLYVSYEFSDFDEVKSYNPKNEITQNEKESYTSKSTITRTPSTDVTYSTQYTTVYLSDVYFVDTVTDGNGIVTISKDVYDPNEQVTFVVTPKKGYVLGSVKVTDANGNVIVFTDYTFTMPSADVTIDATFVKAGVNPNTKDNIIIVIALLAIALITTVILRKQKKELI